MSRAHVPFPHGSPSLADLEGLAEEQERCACWQDSDGDVHYCGQHDLLGRAAQLWDRVFDAHARVCDAPAGTADEADAAAIAELEEGLRKERKRIIERMRHLICAELDAMITSDEPDTEAQEAWAVAKYEVWKIAQRLQKESRP